MPAILETIVLLARIDWTVVVWFCRAQLLELLSNNGDRSARASLNRMVSSLDRAKLALEPCSPLALLQSYVKRSYLVPALRCTFDETGIQLP